VFDNLRYSIFSRSHSLHAMSHGDVVRGFEGMLLSDLVDMVPGLAERLFPGHRITCLMQVR